MKHWITWSLIALTLATALPFALADDADTQLKEQVAIAKEVVIETVIQETASTDPAMSAIEKLKEENQKLRQEIAELRLELARLQSNRQPLCDEHVTPDEANTPKPNDATTQPADSAGNITPHDPTATKEPTTFRTADQIFQAVPNELRPGRDGWDLPQRLAVERWLKDNIPGSNFNAQLAIQSVSVGYNTVRQNWTVTFHFTPREMRYHGWGTQQKIRHITLQGDRTLAERARKIKEGTRIHVKGAIASAGWGFVIGQVVDEPWKPRHFEIALDNAQVQTLHLRQ